MLSQILTLSVVFLLSVITLSLIFQPPTHPPHTIPTSLTLTTTPTGNRQNNRIRHHLQLDILTNDLVGMIKVSQGHVGYR